jgi:hypothetical protein
MTDKYLQQVIYEADVLYGQWYDSKPVPGEEYSVSHDIVREFMPDMIRALDYAVKRIERLEAE